MSWSIWLIIAIILFISEIIGIGMFFFACLGIGALLTALLVLFVIPLWVQWVFFVFASVLSIYFIRPIAMRLFKAKNIVKSNVDALIGKKAVVTEVIDPVKPGMIKVDGDLWRAESDTRIEINTLVEIESVQGVHLQVKQIKE
ncbi:MAG: NfeD family protein [Elusimicrobia bacterium]|nr:NfeD family protein [Candidatus Liberimonas magnetica]